MSLWNKILLGFVFVASLAFFYMAARTMATHQEWRTSALAFEEKLAQVQTQNRQLQLGTSGEEPLMGIEDLQLALHKMMIDRGRVWKGVEPQQVDGESGAVRVGVDMPEPHGITDQAVLAVFEEKDIQEGGQFLGEFKVTQVAEKQVAMEPTMKLSQRELKRLRQSPGPWRIYDIMPIDDPEIFASLEEDELRQLLPESSVATYIRHGEEAQPDDPEDQVKDGKFVRQLRDYDVLLKEYHYQESVLSDLIAGATGDNARIEAAVADAKQQVEFRKQELAELKTTLAKHTRELEAVAAHHNKLDEKLAAIRASVNRLLENNQLMVGEIARIQFEATNRIDERTNRVARAENGG